MDIFTITIPKQAHGFNGTTHDESLIYVYDPNIPCKPMLLSKDSATVDPVTGDILLPYVRRSPCASTSAVC